MNFSNSMPSQIHGTLNGAGLQFAIVQSHFNHFFGDKLLEGAVEALMRCGVDSQSITVVQVPGAYEIPWAMKTLAAAKRHHALIALGVLIRGHTPHFDFIAPQVTGALTQLSLEFETPILNGIITADTLEQAMERAGTKAGNRGFDAGMGAVEMATLAKQLQARLAMAAPKKNKSMGSIG